MRIRLCLFAILLPLAAHASEVDPYTFITADFSAADQGGEIVPAVVKAQRAVLPRHVPLAVVGGVTPDKVAGYLAAGADGFGLGGALYQPGLDADERARRARAFLAALREARA